MSETTIELDGPLAGIALGPAAQACSERERKFAFLIAINATGGDATAAAARAGYGKVSWGGLKVTAHHLLHRERVIAAVSEFTRNSFRGLESVCVAKIRKIVENEKHRDHAKVCLSLLSRFGYSEQTRTEVNVTGSIAVDHTSAALEDLRKLKSLGFSREQLIQNFGFSGLSRYEQLLAERDARAPRVIEHKADELPAGSVDQHHNPMAAP
jgi:hypothetical protein